MAYLDDIIVIGKSFENQIQNLSMIFDRIKSANLKQNPEKCTLLKKEVKFLGHVVNEDGVSTDPDKTMVIREWSTLKNMTDVRGFLYIITFLLQKVYKELRLQDHCTS